MSYRQMSHLTLVVAVILALVGCGERPYRTVMTANELAKIKKQTICVISFAGDLKVDDFDDAREYEKEVYEKDLKDLPEKLNDTFYKSFINKFRNSFSLAKTDYSRAPLRIDVSDKAKIADFINRQGADIGIIAHNQFVYRWDVTTQMLDTYLVVTYFSLVNKRGDEIWRFHAYAEFGPMTGVTGFLTAVAAQMPPGVTILNDHLEYFANYSTVITGLINDDLQGKPHGSEFADYVDRHNLSPFLLRPVKIYLRQLAHD